ncbi:hypothetical protein EJ06DRAFT_433110 [Trichodelitschia bisporula]|uniref:RNA polymerase Rpb4/RPC9 core domain-containing protein n=1 Tax=Trichodelitschia bisporula TaxID=703511 RepID=A0A6G1HX75_9PEZI|nr:hypothetical protein EJ06DRAFT_433110 [Trichodelitschia bisporula]
MNGQNTNGNAGGNPNAQSEMSRRFAKPKIPDYRIAIRERPKTTPVDEEAGQELHLGEFRYVHALSVSEARLIMDKSLENRQKHNKKIGDSEVFLKMQTYIDTFARFRAENIVVELELLFHQYPALETFERSQLISLCPGEAEEAKTLIPSITDKISDDDLQQLLDDIAARRQYMVDA